MRFHPVQTILHAAAVIPRALAAVVHSGPFRVEPQRFSLDPREIEAELFCRNDD